MLSTVTFVTPANPGTTPIIPADTTVTNIAIIVHQRAVALILFQEYLAMDNALKQQVVSCVNSIYLHTLTLTLTVSPASQMLQYVKCYYSFMQSTDALAQLAYKPTMPE